MRLQPTLRRVLAEGADCRWPGVQSLGLWTQAGRLSYLLAARLPHAQAQRSWWAQLPGAEIEVEKTCGDSAAGRLPGPEVCRAGGSAARSFLSISYHLPSTKAAPERTGETEQVWKEGCPASLPHVPLVLWSGRIGPFLCLMMC